LSQPNADFVCSIIKASKTGAAPRGADRFATVLQRANLETFDDNAQSFDKFWSEGADVFE
jgi:hypothetical protein